MKQYGKPTNRFPRKREDWFAHRWQDAEFRRALNRRIRELLPN